MASAREVTPGSWSDIIVVYDDGEYSAIWGRFRCRPYRVLGVRWNKADGEIGYPSAFGRPQWYVEPDFLARPVLLALQEKMTKSTNIANRDICLKNIVVALDEAPAAGT